MKTDKLIIEKQKELINKLSAALEKEVPEEKNKYDYSKIRKAGMPCLKGISCNLCESIDKVNFTKCLDKSEFASDDELKEMGLIEG
jgi:hypothetical protein